MRVMQRKSSQVIVNHVCRRDCCCRGTTGPLAGGVAHHASTHWQPNSHKSSQGPLAAFPFPLPPEYDAALQQQYGVVTELRSKIKGSGLDDSRRQSLQVGKRGAWGHARVANRD
jgi:hypothetical protein